MSTKPTMVCDGCGAIAEEPPEKPGEFIHPLDKIKYICDTYGWTWGGCNIALLCNECKDKVNE